MHRLLNQNNNVINNTQTLFIDYPKCINGEMKIEKFPFIYLKHVSCSFGVPFKYTRRKIKSSCEIFNLHSNII